MVTDGQTDRRTDICNSRVTFATENINRILLSKDSLPQLTFSINQLSPLINFLHQSSFFVNQLSSLNFFHKLTFFIKDLDLFEDFLSCFDILRGYYRYFHSQPFFLRDLGLTLWLNNWLDTKGFIAWTSKQIWCFQFTSCSFNLILVVIVINNSVVYYSFLTLNFRSGKFGWREKEEKKRV